MRIKGIKIDEDVAKILSEAWGGPGNDPLLSNKSKKVKLFKEEVTDAIFEIDKNEGDTEMLSALTVLRMATVVSGFTGRLSKVKMNVELQNKLSDVIDRYLSLFPYYSILSSTTDPKAQDFNMPIINQMRFANRISKDDLVVKDYQDFLKLVEAAYNLLPPENIEYSDSNTVIVLPSATTNFYEKDILQLAQTWVEEVNVALHDIIVLASDYIDWLAQYKRAFESLQNTENIKIEDEE